MSKSSVLKVTCATSKKNFNLYIVIKDDNMSESTSLVISEQLTELFKESENVLKVEVAKMNAFSIEQYSDVIKTITNVADSIKRISSL